jgi:hypothetical protein
LLSQMAGRRCRSRNQRGQQAINPRKEVSSTSLPGPAKQVEVLSDRWIVPAPACSARRWGRDSSRASSPRPLDPLAVSSASLTDPHRKKFSDQLTMSCWWWFC